jgi:hypothetical protein
MIFSWKITAEHTNEHIKCIGRNFLWMLTVLLKKMIIIFSIDNTEKIWLCYNLVSNSCFLPRAHSWRQLEVEVRVEIKLELGVMIHILENL